jgi:peptide-methionine (S)-S-oxide reductase
MKSFRAFLIFVASLSFQSQSRAKAPLVEEAILAAGCFWCIQPPYDKLKGLGVISTSVGYSGGYSENPTYAEVSSGLSGHKEVIQVVFDPTKISYKKILEVYWKNVDPFNSDGQFCDVGKQYTSAIYYTTEAQKKIAEEMKASHIKSMKQKGSVFTEILPAKKFYPAEDYHQSFYEKNPVRYNAYKFACGREKRLKQVWEK